MVRALVAIGSNLGDRAEHLRVARRRMNELPGSGVVRCSEVYQTPPVGPAGQGAYYNAACELETSLSARALHAELQRIEREAGRDRDREEKWGPRTLDLDLLLYADRVVEDDRLTVPHPRMHERAFVLQPVCDIAPDWPHPRIERTMEQLLADLPTDGIERIDDVW